MARTAEITRIGRSAGSVYGWLQQQLDRRLDRLWGLPPSVASRIELDEVGFAERDRKPYGPSPWGVLGRVLARREVTPNDVFLDLGCGMGRVVLEAGRRPFRRVIGVDVVPQFTSVAREAVSRNRKRLRCPQIEIVTEDARDYRVPDDVTFVYLAAPFGEDLLQLIMTRIVDSFDRKPRRLRIIYMFPPDAPALEGLSRVRRVRYGRRAIRRWAQADYLAVYEITPAPLPPYSHI